MKDVLLIADDDASIRTVFSMLFAGSCDLLAAADGDEALRLAAARKPALVFLDVDMPGRSGLEVLAEARPLCPDTVFWMLTANDDLDTVNRAMALGAAGYLTKPFEAARIRDIARDVFGRDEEKPWTVQKPEGDGR
jgi:DNA-binding NtrC family response regulator